MKKILFIAVLLVGYIAIGQKYPTGIVTGPMTTTAINAISSPQEGRLIGNSTTETIWYYNGTAWVDTGVAIIPDGSITEAKLNTSVNASLDLADTALQNVVEDLTPQLGGNLDVNGKVINGSGQISLTGGNYLHTIGNGGILSKNSTILPSPDDGDFGWRAFNGNWDIIGPIGVANTSTIKVSFPPNNNSVANGGSLDVEVAEFLGKVAGQDPTALDHFVTKGYADANYAAGTSLPVDDTTALVQDPVDNTKTGLIDVGNVPTGTSATLTIQGDNDFQDELKVSNTSSSTIPLIKMERGASLFDWGFGGSASSDLLIFSETTASSGIFGFAYGLAQGGVPTAAYHLTDKGYVDGLDHTDDQTLSLGGIGNKDLTILDGNTVDLTGVTGIDPNNVIGTISGRTNIGSISNFAEQSLADYNTDGAPSAGVKILIKDPLGMEEVTAGSSTIDWIDSDGYLIAKDLYLDNTTDDVESFTLQDQNIGYTVEIYLNQANEPTFTGSPTLVGGLDWTDDSLANTDVTVLVFRTGKGVRKAYRLGH